MAKRKKAPVRRRRVSGTGGYGGVLQVVAGAVAGGIASRMIATSVGKNMDPKLVALGQIGLGAVVVNSMKSPLMKGVGIGIAVEGATALAQKFGVIKGIDDVDAEIGGEYLEDAVGADDPYLQTTVAGY